MSDRIKALYQTHILQKAKEGAHEGVLENATHHFEAYNPLCGDQFTIHLIIRENKIVDARFEGYGCSISKASTATLTAYLIGKEIEQARAMIEDFLKLIDEESERAPEEISQDDQLLAFAAAREFPERRSCASLSWEALQEGLIK